jgi:predicted ArsR family transcriptional regulator
MTDQNLADQNDWQMARRSGHAPPTRTMADLLFLPDTERSLMNWLLRQQSATLAEVAAHLNETEAAAQLLLKALTDQGFVQLVQQAEQSHYHPKLTVRKGRKVPPKIWDALE